MSLIKLILIAVFAFFAFKQCQSSGEVTLGPGIKAQSAPTQTALENAEPFRFDEYVITPLADFSIEAKVLAREDYWLGRESDLSPTDLALGWQKMSDESVLSQIDISQSGRWYRWRVQQFPIPRREIETQSANMHFVPANDAVESVLSRVKQGEVIQARGYLIQVQADDGWSWRSSTSRQDTGNGACELIYVTELEIRQP
jgi:hypothetical protein